MLPFTQQLDGHKELKEGSNRIFLLSLPRQYGNLESGSLIPVRNIAFSDLIAYLMHGREIEFTYKGRKYSITNYSDHWYLCDDTEHILLETVCRFEEKEILVSKISDFIIDNLTIKQIFDRQAYEAKGIDII